MTKIVSINKRPGQVAELTRGRPNWWVGVGAITFVVAALVITAQRTDPRFPFVAGETGWAQIPTPEMAPYLVGNHIVATVLMALLGLIGVVIAIRMSVLHRSLLPLVLALSVAVTAITEVFIDKIGGGYFPFSNTETFGNAYSLLGRTMPVWIVAAWFGYGVFAVITYRMLTSRTSTRVLWYWLGASLVGDVVLEEVLLKFDLFHYYGNQLLVLLGEMPWWFMPCNAVGVMLAAAIAHRFRSNLRGIGALCMLVVTPVSVGAIYGLIGIPGVIAANSDYSWLVTQVLGLITIVLGVFAFMGVLKLVLNRDPFDLDYKPSDGEFSSFSASVGVGQGLNTGSRTREV